MLKAEVWIPFEFRIAELLLGFRVAPMRVTPHSWKIIKAVSWFCEWRGELLVCKLLQGYVAFVRKGDVKLIDYSLDPALEWKLRFIFTQLMLENDSWGVPDRGGVGGLTTVGSDLPSGHYPLLVLFEGGFSLLVRGFIVAYTTTLVPSSSEAKRKKERKKHLQERERLLTEGESIREEGTNLQAAITSGKASVVVFETPAKLDYMGMICPTLVSPLEGISIAIEGSSSIGVLMGLLSA
ncbi:hypothetical protein ACLOJK_037188, partial [Asimina triloba]